MRVPSFKRYSLEKDGISMNKYVEQALSTFLLLEDADIERVLARHYKEE